MRGRLFFLMFLIIISNSFAAKLDIILEPKEITILANETGTVNLTINHDADLQFFRLSSPDYYWDVSTKDALRVPGGNFTTKLIIKSLHSFSERFDVPIILSSNRFPDARATLTVNLVAVNTTLSYLPAIKGSIVLTDLLQYNNASAEVIMENRNYLAHPKITVRLEGSSFSAQTQTALQPLEKKRIIIGFYFNETMIGQEDFVRAYLILNETDTIDLGTKQVKIVNQSKGWFDFSFALPEIPSFFALPEFNLPSFTQEQKQSAVLALLVLALSAVFIWTIVRFRRKIRFSKKIFIAELDEGVPKQYEITLAVKSNKKLPSFTILDALPARYKFIEASAQCSEEKSTDQNLYLKWFMPASKKKEFKLKYTVKNVDMTKDFDFPFAILSVNRKKIKSTIDVGG